LQFEKKEKKGETRLKITSITKHYQFVQKAQNRNVLLIAEKTCNKLLSALWGASTPWGASEP
jgi:hypothetical protein